MFNRITKTLAGAVALAALASVASADNWRGWNIHVDGYPNTVAMDKFAELLAVKTGGEYTLQMFHGGTLGSQPDAIEQVRAGALEIGNFNLGPIGPLVPAANVVSLPFIFKDVPHMFRVLDGEAGKIIAAGMAEKGIQPLAWYDAGARSFYNGEKPINTPADVEGMKVRVMNNELFTGMIAELGGNPSPMAFAEVYQALKTGVVDGAENNWPSYESTGHFEVAGFYSLSQHLIIPECICINIGTFNALSDEMKTAVLEAAQESALYQRDLWNKREAASRAAVEAAGVVVNEIADKAPFQAAMAPVYEAYFEANPDLRPLVELIQATE
ncbi:C4-dicarboxylate ABC transporter [Roseobacter denitrificans]|uniref:TRAP dicarboxylate ABC transporter, substrate-binding protein n=1 Tax=Roseobacter denitrificans (strain ATCC 33942 / OCh 114) TaxID=375451 RepID=Q160Z9_ROSDO|nr:TRAP transporter substrate-binding protein [Roseobacter denitrificans]ABG33444.1 TRAP dicarboxylate ABC transporter, substrate-binding protein [Roseobacter denitrificans OCh 114]AVL52763.1 C4-dicarboxylate ABC transporter [Roseobacter denitrificans]SFG49588.1 tripartite ATP-independent transporter solute receptor, DctP family [Roseobacter denitrificans OCh 114]